MGNVTYYPPPAFSFAVAVLPSSGAPSSQQAAVDGAFEQVSGLDARVEVEEVVEGGVNSYVHRLPGVTKSSNLVLRRGYVTQNSNLAQWALQTVGSTLGDPIQPQGLTVSLLGPNQQPMAVWTFQNAWPIRWEVGPFDASRNEVLTETLEIAYTTVTRTLNQASGGGTKGSGSGKGKS